MVDPKEVKVGSVLTWGKAIWGAIGAVVFLVLAGWTAYQEVDNFATKEWVSKYESSEMKKLKDEVHDLNSSIASLQEWTERYEERAKQERILESYRADYNVRLQEWVKLSNNGALLEKPKKYPQHVKLEAELIGD